MDYELEIDGGSLNSVFVPVSTYTSGLFTHKLETDPLKDNLTPGEIYTLRFKAQNMAGWSDYSQLLRVGVGAKATKPTNLAIVKESSGPSFIHIEWD